METMSQPYRPNSEPEKGLPSLGRAWCPSDFRTTGLCGTRTPRSLHLIALPGYHQESPVLRRLDLSVFKEGKLQQARRIAPEWVQYDDELQSILDKLDL